MKLRFKSWLISKKYYFLIIATVIIFFYPIFKEQIPFPGDLLVSEYNPWKSYSYEGYVPGSIPNKAQYIDTVRQLYPWKTEALAQLKNKEFALWNPYSFSGAPLMANFQSAVFYPLNLLYFIFSQIDAWTILVILQPLLAFIFTYLYARKMGIGLLGGLFSAVSFSFSYFMAVWVEYNTVGHVVAWLPLALLSIEHLFRKFTFKWSIIFVFSLVSSLLGGHPQVSAYLFILTLIYVLFRFFSQRKNQNKKIIFSILSLQILSLGITAIQFVPGIELIKEAARNPQDYQFLINKTLIQPWQLIMILVPDFFGNPAVRNYWLEDTYFGKVTTSIGIIPLFFVLFSILNKKKSLEIFFLITSVVVLFISTNNPLAAIFYKIQLPLISSSSPTLAIFILSFSFSILAGFGIDKWRKENLYFKKLIIWLSPILLVFIFLWAIILIAPFLFDFSWEKNLSVSLRNLLYSSFIFSIGVFLIIISYYRKKLLPAILIILLLVHTFDLWRSFHKFNPFSQRDLVFPNTQIFSFLKDTTGINRIWGYGSGAIEPNFPLQYRIFSPEGYDPLYPGRYGEFIHSSFDGEILEKFSIQTRSDAVIAPGFGEKDFPSNLYRLKVINSLGVKYVLDKEENGSTSITFPPEQFNLIYKTGVWRVFENLKAAPRFFMTSDYKLFKTKEEFENLFFSDNFDPGKTILLEEQPTGNFVNGDKNSVKLSFYGSDRIEFLLENSSDSLFYLSDTYYPGWKAYVDGKETNIQRANYAFRAVVIPSKSKKLVLRYLPDSFRIGAIISTGSVLLVSYSIYFWIRKRYNNNLTP